MKRNFLRSSLAALCCLAMLTACDDNQPAPPPVGGGENSGPDDQHGYDVFLLIGQSNMAGRGKMAEGDDQPFSEQVFLLDDAGTAVPAVNPLNRYSSIRKDLSEQGVNPGFGFSKKVAGQTGRKILLVVNARGGSHINDWSTDKDYYKEAVRRTRQAQQLGSLVGILWHQGEAGSSAPEGYLDKLKPIVEGLRRDLGTANVPFVAGEIASWHENASKFNPVIRGIGEAIPYTDWVSSEGCTPLIDASDPHFSRDGQILLGERYADKVLKMCYDK